MIKCIHIPQFSDTKIKIVLNQYETAKHMKVGACFTIFFKTVSTNYELFTTLFKAR